MEKRHNNETQSAQDSQHANCKRIREGTERTEVDGVVSSSLSCLESARAPPRSLPRCEHPALLAEPSLPGGSSGSVPPPFLQVYRQHSFSLMMLDPQPHPHPDSTPSHPTDSNRRCPPQLLRLARQPAQHRAQRALAPVGEHGLHLRQVHLRRALPATQTKLLLHLRIVPIPFMLRALRRTPHRQLFRSAHRLRRRDQLAVALCLRSTLDRHCINLPDSACAILEQAVEMMRICDV